MPLESLTITPAEMLLAAKAARASYHNTVEEIATYLTPLGLSGTIQPFAQEDAEGFVYQDESVAILAFRGSQTVGDWLYNANVELTEWEGTGRVHKGFLAALDVCWPLLATSVSEIAGRRPLLITGHSLGGAMAVLAAERLRQGGTPAAAVITFGNPKVGDAAFAQAFGQGYAQRACSVLNHGDPVPWLPMLQGDFTVSGEGVFFTNHGEYQSRPPQWQAMLMLVGGLLSEEHKNWLDFLPHSKDTYLRLAEEHFSD